MKSKNLGTLIVKGIIGIKPLAKFLFKGLTQQFSWFGRLNKKMFTEVKENIKKDTKAIKCKTGKHDWDYSVINIDLPMSWRRGHLKYDTTADCDTRTCKSCDESQHNLESILNPGLTKWKKF